ncbi:probable cytochrome P450 6a14 [Halyomorpha halys]|uniref:probable cytochrome P450 6a14 n=1 Tax=Halyomorpha halys TaxID=286706 RepID=UPI0006D50BB8
MGLVTNDWKIDILIAISTLCLLLYYKIKSIYTYFEKRNIKYVKPKFLLGSEPDGPLMKIHIAESWDRVYKKLENEKYGGFYHSILPMLMIRDPEYINDILKTSFEHFPDRIFHVDGKTNPLDQHLFFIRGNKWRYLRSKLSPLFSQVKLKWMYEEIENCANIFVECMKEIADGKDVDMKELLARCTTDVISSCAFGVEPQSLKDPNSEFRQIGKDFFDPNKINMLLTFFRIVIPRILLWFKIKTVTTRIRKFFLTTTENILHQRRSTGLVRKDFVHLLLELKEKGSVQIDTKETEKNKTHDESTKENIELTDTLLAAQSFVFFIAGFETTSTTLHYTLYMLAKHKDIQDKARKEVQEVKAKYGQFTFDSLKELKFLNNVISETLRLHPPVTMLIRECTKDYTLPDGTFIEKGLNILIPTYSIQRDPKYFPEPLKFKPDRFENPPANGTYLPFGDGPRICIGKRFAEAVVTTILARSLDKYEFDLSPMDKRGDEDIKLNPRVPTSTPLHGLFLRVHKIDHSN